MPFDGSRSRLGFPNLTGFFFRFRAYIAGWDRPGQCRSWIRKRIFRLLKIVILIAVMRQRARMSEVENGMEFCLLRRVSGL